MKELVDLDEVYSFGWLEKKVEILMMLLVYFYNFVVKTLFRFMITWVQYQNVCNKIMLFCANVGLCN
jgi:hypothetical protein